MPKHYCLTFFNKPILAPYDESIRYFIAGEEICPTTNKLHWQSYIELNTNKTMKQLKEFFNDNSIHIERRKGSRDEAKTYCMKDNKYTEYGIWISGQGYRTDLQLIKKEILNGATFNEIVMNHTDTYCRYRNGIRDIYFVCIEEGIPKWRNIEVILLCGGTGIGKTRLAMTNATYKIIDSNFYWWDGYMGDKVICIDEFINKMNIQMMLTILDGYRLRIPTKGGFTYAAWNCVYITTNLEIEQIYADEPNVMRAAFFRRVSKILHKEQISEVLQVILSKTPDDNTPSM